MDAVMEQDRVEKAKQAAAKQADSAVPADAAADPSQLDGVEGAADLPAPDPLPKAVEGDTADMIDMLGEYVTRCLYSKPWQLREAAYFKIAIDLQDSKYTGVAPATVLRVCCQTVNMAMGDRIAQVFLSSANVLSAMLELVSEKLPARDLQHALDPILKGAAERLGDGNARCRDGAQGILLEVRGVQAS